MIDLSYTISKLATVQWYAVIAFLTAFFLTPFVGKLAQYLGAIDVPRNVRLRVDIKALAESAKNQLPRLGGVAIVASFLLTSLLVGNFSPIYVAVAVGVLILLVAGILDDIYDLPGWAQFLTQLLACVVVVSAGVRIDSISFWDWQVGLVSWNYMFNDIFSFMFPADLISIFWLLVIINAMNWVAGIDALEESMSIAGGVTLMLLSIKLGNEAVLPFVTIFTFATLGFWVFNFPPAKIISGTVGNTVLGFLLAIFAILIDGKYTTSIILLALPLVDFVWVLVWRLREFREFNPIKLMNIGGDHHLHHRLMKWGYSKTETLFVEMMIFGVFAILAYYFAGFNILAIAVVAVFGILIALFGFISIRSHHRSQMIQKAIEQKKDDPNDPPPVSDPPVPQASPESKYAY